MVDAAVHLVPTRPRSLLFRFSRELAAMLILFMIYKFGRVVYTSDVSVAYDNAQRVWELERFLRLPNELAAQQAMLAFDGLIQFANAYYMFAHLPGTGAFLVWMYLRRPGLYPAVRRSLIAVTAVALVAHLAFPLAPPRMMGHLGFVDTGAVFGPQVYNAPHSGSLVNQYAAMPSLHVGWAILVAAGLIAAFKTRWRWLALLHPTITAVAVIGTANHFWLDSIAACLLLTVAIYLFGNTPRVRLARLVPAPLRRQHAPAISIETPPPAALTSMKLAPPPADPPTGDDQSARHAPERPVAALSSSSS